MLFRNSVGTTYQQEAVMTEASPLYAVTYEPVALLLYIEPSC